MMYEPISKTWTNCAASNILLFPNPGGISHMKEDGMKRFCKEFAQNSDCRETSAFSTHDFSVFNLFAGRNEFLNKIRNWASTFP